MKKLIVILAVVLLPLVASAQTAEFKKFYKVYDNREGYTTVMMSGEMFSSLQGNATSGNQTIRSIYIVTTSRPTAEFKSDISQVILNPEYNIQTSINDGDDKVRIYVRKQGNSIVEILMTVYGADETVVMCLTGQNLNVNSVSQMAGGS